MKFGSKKLFLIIGVLIFILSSIFSFLMFYYFMPQIELLGEKVVRISVGQPYVESGYKAYTGKIDLHDKVIINGEVDVDKLGRYELSYKVKSFIFSDTKTRIVEVFDDVAPKIELLGNIDVYLCSNVDYKEEGYKVSDNYDVDLEDKVVIEKKDNIIYYSVKDSSLNETVVKRNIYYDDKEKPVIKLAGKDVIYMYLNDKYNELGATASDNCDGDISSKIKIGNLVNSNKVGTYNVIYEVVDNNGNKTSVTRVVKVIEKVITNNKSGVIYLTFDDGPSRTITASILNILKEEGVKATFFVVNHSNDLNYLIKREHDEGHTVALHSYTHNYADIYSSKSNYFRDLEKIGAKVKSITGEESKIIRFPGGSSNSISKNYKKGIMSELTKEVVSRGYHYFDWNVSSGDAGGVKSSKQVYNNVTSNLSINRANVVLMHDFENNYYTLNALRDIIRYGKNNGYKFSRITMDTGMVKHGVVN